MIEGKDLIQFGADEAGRKALQFTVDRTELGKNEAPINVIVRPMLAGDNERALTIARFLCDYKNAMDAMRQQVEAGDRSINALTELLEKTRARCNELRHKLDVACGLGLGRARGTFYAREDRGKVWLHYDKDPGSFALCFAGWSDLANSRPELRPVGVGFEAGGPYVELAEVAVAVDRDEQVGRGLEQEDRREAALRKLNALPAFQESLLATSKAPVETEE